MLTKIIFANLLVSLISFTGILLFLKKDISKKSIKLIISLATGALLGVIFFSLLPELFSPKNNNGQSLSTTALSTIILVSIIIFFLIEKYFHWHHCQCDQPNHQHSKKPMGYINLIGDGLHNFVDGSLIAATFLIDPALGTATTLAIVFHEIPQEISDMGILIYSGFSKNQALFWNFISALTAIAGGIITYYFNQSISHLTPILLAVATGSFLYLSMADIMPELHHENDGRQLQKQFVMLIGGILLVYTISLFMHE